MASKPNAVPPYGHRKGYIPRTPADFGDGGAFPEIHVRQHPRPERKATGTTLAQTVAADGSVNFGSIAQQGGNKHRTVFSSFTDLIPKPQLATGDQLVRPDEEEVKDTAKETAKALQQLVEKRVAATNPKNLPDQGGSAQLIKYTPATQTGTTGAKQRLIKIQDAPVDPLEPPKFRHMKAPKGSGSPPVPVMHSPPRAATKATLEDWKIPPMVSNWKNPKGFIIPLDKRLAADGRGLQTTQINDNFAKFAEALSVAESRARESVNMRQKMRKELAQRERDRKEEELRAMAARAREERLGGPAAAARVDDAPPAGGYPRRRPRPATAAAATATSPRGGTPPTTTATAGATTARRGRTARRCGGARRFAATGRASGSASSGWRRPGSAAGG
ncbi:unnamed protein product [Pedinophyceae sp. YPF-701]|nr:unnamed protein product [Pedinophyceae sp. YPF-701]